MAQPFALIGQVMNKRAANVPRAVGLISRSIAAQIGEAVVRDTPVDTGAARSKWIMSIDQIATFIIPPYAPYPKTHSEIYAYHANERKAGRTHLIELGRKDEEANAVSAISQHFATLQNFDPARNSTIYIANNVPYMGKLDAGYSPQTPAGFVMRAVEKGVMEARKLNLKLMGA